MALGDELIDLTEIRKYRDVDAGFSSFRFSAFLKQVQEQDLKDVLGAELWLDFFKNSPDAKYQTLIDGEEYVSAGETVLYTGLKPFLVWSWLSKLPIEGNVHHTQSGDFSYLHDVTSKPTKAEIMHVKEDYKTSALIERNEIVRYLNENVSTYPQWNYKNKENRSSVQFDII